MRRVAVALLVAIAAGVLGAGGLASADPTKEQALFTRTLLDDAKTGAGVKRMLRDGTGFVDPRSGFVDVTGDGRQDALVLVTTGGAAGSVAVYVLSTDGQTGSDLKLKAIFRMQSLYRATVRISGTTLSVFEPRWAAGDDLCCPGKLRERDYQFAPRTSSFRRVADHDVPFV